MGSSFSKPWQDLYRQQQSFQEEAQRIQMERQLAMQTLIQERATAMDMAKSRDLAYYFIAFTVLASAVIVPLAFRRNQSMYLFVLFPPASAAEYYYNIGLSDGMKKHREIAQELIAGDFGLFDPPNGPITVDEIEYRRNRKSDTI